MSSPGPSVPAKGTPCTCPIEGAEAPLKWVESLQCVLLAELFTLLLDLLNLPLCLCPLHLRYWTSPGLACGAPRVKLHRLSAYSATCLPAAYLSIPHGVQPACSAAAHSLGWEPLELPEFPSLDLE